MDQYKWIPEHLRSIAQERYDREMSFRTALERADRTPAWRKSVLAELEREYR